MYMHICMYVYVYIHTHIYAVPVPWVARYDEASNDYFFWNTVTGATTWSKPPFPAGFPARYAACRLPPAHARAPVRPP